MCLTLFVCSLRNLLLFLVFQMNEQPVILEYNSFLLTSSISHVSKIFVVVVIRNIIPANNCHVMFFSLRVETCVIPTGNEFITH